LKAFQTLAERETVNPEEGIVITIHLFVKEVFISIVFVARERATALSNISDAFIIQTTQIAKTIIEEYALSRDKKTILPLSEGKISGLSSLSFFPHFHFSLPTLSLPSLTFATKKEQMARLPPSCILALFFAWYPQQGTRKKVLILTSREWVMRLKVTNP
jgi:hypothetical protein